MCWVTVMKMTYVWCRHAVFVKEQTSSFSKTSLFNRQGLGRELDVVMVMCLHIWFYCTIPREWLVQVTCSNKMRYELSVGALWMTDTNREFNHWLSELWFGVSWKTWHRAVKDTAADISRIIQIKSGDFQQKKKKQKYDFRKESASTVAFPFLFCYFSSFSLLFLTAGAENFYTAAVRVCFLTCVCGHIEGKWTVNCKKYESMDSLQHNHIKNLALIKWPEK